MTVYVLAEQKEGGLVRLWDLHDANKKRLIELLKKRKFQFIADNWWIHEDRTFFLEELELTEEERNDYLSTRFEWQV